jgi:hypothetical protein
MMKKTIASVGLAAAATTGALFLTGSPASAQTTQAPARAGVAYVQPSAVADRHYGDHHYGDQRGHYRHQHHHYYWNRHYNVDLHRIVISSNNTNVAVDD